jgi:DNA processing protein
MNDTLALLWLNNVESIGAKKKHILSVVAGSPSALFHDLVNYKDEVVELCGEEVYGELLSTNNEEFIDNMLNLLDKLEANVITYLDEGYPFLLREIEDFPILLYYKGDVSLLNDNVFAVVGTRSITSYGKKATQSFVTDLVGAGFTIVSGMARGIDTAAHNAALDACGKTIAVWGTGIDVVYPPENSHLAKRIVENGGLIVTELKPASPAMHYHFPVRNRLISALSVGVLVPEAGLKSGSLITLDYALDHGKNIYIVPGQIYSPQSEGCNQMLKDAQGALVTNINDILIDYNVEERTCGINDNIELDFQQNIVYEALKDEELHFDKLLQVTGLDVATLNSLLTGMMIKGIIEDAGGNYYSLS